MTSHSRQQREGEQEEEENQLPKQQHWPAHELETFVTLKVTAFLALALPWREAVCWRPTLINSVTTQAHIRGFDGLLTSKITHLRSAGALKGLDQWSTAAGAPWLLETGYPRESSVRVWCWWGSRRQRPWTRPRTHCSEHLQAELFGWKGRV